MIDPRIEAALLPLLQTGQPYEERFKAVPFGRYGDPLLHPPKRKLKRDIILPTIDTSDYRAMTLYFMDFLFRHFQALESVEWDTALEYDDQSGYANDPYHITINERIAINDCSCFKPDYCINNASNERLAAIHVDGLDPEADFEATWASMSDDEQLAWYAKVEEMGDQYYEQRRQAATSAYLAENNLIDAIYTAAGMICLLAELCFCHLYNENETEYDIMIQRFPSAVKATREGVSFTMRAH